VIFLSRKSDLAPGKPLRGGIPVVFPWFATDSKRTGSMGIRGLRMGLRGRRTGR